MMETFNNREYWDIPPDWKIIALKHLCKISALYGLNEQSESYTDEGVRFLRTTDIAEDGTLNDSSVYLPIEKVQGYLLSMGDVLLSRSGTVGRCYVHKQKQGDFSYAGYLVRFILKDKLNPYYLFFLTKTNSFKQWLFESSIESTIGNVNGEKYANMPVPVPPLDFQNKIVQFLNEKTTEIDRLITAKKNLLSLLDEKKQALIAHAVTRGLDPDVGLKDSGIPWLGLIPEHWQPERTKWLLPEIDERSETGEEELLSVSHLTGVTLRSEKNVNMFMAESLEGYKKCDAGDLVINTLWAWMGAMGVSRVNGVVSPAYNVYRPVEAILPDYLDMLVRMPNFVSEITRYSKGVWSSRLRLYPEGLYEAYIPVPPLEEQKQIVSELKSQLEHFAKLYKATEKTISLLQERRAALISAAVTGKIDQEVLDAN